MPSTMQVLEILTKDLDENSQILADIKIDPVFRKLSKNSVGFHVWKVDLDRIEAVPKSQYGTFYDDSTYIISATCTPGSFINQDTIVRELKNPTNLQRYIHFWLGAETSSQKSGNVAYKVMELDTYFDNIATQYRETQGNESTRFLSYFKNGVTILSGNMEICDQESRLYQITGKKCSICVEKTPVSWEHFSSSHIMVLQTPKYIFVWIGRASTSTERRNALNTAKRLQEEHQIPELTIVDDGYEQAMNDSRKREWNKYLCLKSRFVHQTSLMADQPKIQMKLYKCGYSLGKYRIEEIKTAPPVQSDLNDSTAAFIIDGDEGGVWVWIGKAVEMQEKVDAMRNARGFVKKKKYPSSTPVVRVMEGHEPIEFMRLFPLWQASDYNSNKVSKIAGKLNSLTLLQRPKMAAETQLIDDGSGEKHIFRITDGHYVELPRQKHTAFFSGDCYVLQYCVPLTGSAIETHDAGLIYVLYFWCGSDVPQDVRNKCERLANDYLDSLGECSMMVKMVQGLETAHFIQIFSGKFIVFKGRASDFDPTGLNSISPLNFILKVEGDATYNGKAAQINYLTEFASKDCFVIKSPTVWVWCGSASTGDAREVAKNIGGLLGEYNLVIESMEPAEFWMSVSEKFSYNQNGFSHESSDRLPAHKFEKTLAGLYSNYHCDGKLTFKEILAFEQSDLSPEEVYILDAGNLIFVWVGDLCSNEEKNTCWNRAKQFLNQYPIDRHPKTAVALIRQEHEPNIFTGYFETWSDKFWKSHVSFEAMRMHVENSVSPVYSSIHSINGDCDFDKYQKYPVYVLQQEADRLPTGVNPTRKEIHLTHDDFVSVFNMKFSEFDCLPGWRKQELKKKHKLF